MAVEFRDPPPQRPRRQLKWAPLCDQLVAKPGQWGRLTTLRDSYQAANAVRSLRSRKVRYPDGRFVFRSDGREVWGCYLGVEQ